MCVCVCVCVCVCGMCVCGVVCGVCVWCVVCVCECVCVCVPLCLSDSQPVLWSLCASVAWLLVCTTFVLHFLPSLTTLFLFPNIQGTVQSYSATFCSPNSYKAVIKQRRLVIIISLYQCAQV